MIQLDREWRRCTSWFHSTDGSCGHKIRAVRPVKEDMAQTMGEAGSGIEKCLSPVLAQRSRRFSIAEGGSRKPLKSGSSLLSNFSLMSELRASAAEFLCPFRRRLCIIPSHPDKSQFQSADRITSSFPVFMRRIPVSSASSLLMPRLWDGRRVASFSG